MSQFVKGQRVVWAPAFLERGRQIDPRWYEAQRNAIGTVDWIQRDGDVLVLWDGDATTCVHPPNRLASLVDADGVCAACEAMPTEHDGRAPFCAAHR